MCVIVFTCAWWYVDICDICYTCKATNRYPKRQYRISLFGTYRLFMKCTGTWNDSIEYRYAIHNECMWYCEWMTGYEWQDTTRHVRIQYDVIGYDTDTYKNVCSKLYALLCFLICCMIHVWWWCYSLSGASYKALNFSRLLVESFQVTGLSTQTDRLIAPSSLILFTLHCV